MRNSIRNDDHMDKRCKKCEGLKSCRDEQTSWFFIIIGFISTIAVRVVTVLMDISPFWGKASWYVGVAGFFIFFLYKFKVFKDRSSLIDSAQLMDKVNGSKPLTETDYEILSVILCKIRSNKERINFLFIFAVSGIALLLAVYVDFIK